MKPSDYLKKGWCQGWFAKDSIGVWLRPDDKAACMWCFAGAAKAAGLQEADLERFESAAERIAYVSEGRSIRQWNDEPQRTQAEAIALAEKVESELGIK